MAMRETNAPDEGEPEDSGAGMPQEVRQDAAPAVLTSPRPVLGISLKLCSTFTFACMAVALKITTESVPIGEIVFARNFFGMFPVLLLVALRGELTSSLRTRQPLGHVGRAMAGIAAMLFAFTSLKYLPIADSTAIGFAAPLFTVVLASVFLGETVRIYRWTAVVIGFLGIVVILSPHIGGTELSGDALFGAGAAATGAFCTAMAMIFVRKLCETERTSTIVIWFSGCASLLSLSTIPVGWIFPEYSWVIPDAKTAGLLVFVGLAGGVGQIVMTESYRYADASTIAPFDYANLLWAVLLSWAIFGEIPVWQVVAGALIVVAAGLFVIYRERALGKDDTRARKASSPLRP